MIDTKISRIMAVILAGGLNKRFSEPKGLIKICGTHIIERNISLLRSIFEDVAVSANAPEIFFRFGSRILGDIVASRGPMSGIYTALVNSSEKDVFVMACDMPFPSKPLIQFLCEKHLLLGSSAGYDATIPIFNGMPQPLFGIYSKTVIGRLKDAIISNKVSMIRFLEEINVFYLDPWEIRQIDPEGKSFLNINTPEDYDSIICGSVKGGVIGGADMAQIK